MMLLSRGQLQNPFQKGKHKSKIPDKDLLRTTKGYIKGYNQLFQDVGYLKNIPVFDLNVLKKYQCHIFYLFQRQIYPI